MDPIKIRIRLLQIGMTQAQIARDLGVTIQAVNRVVHGRTRSNRIETYVYGLIENGKAGMRKAA